MTTCTTQEKAYQQFNSLNAETKQDKVFPFKRALNETGFKYSGFINITELSFCPGFGDIKAVPFTLKNRDISIGIRTVNGYQFNYFFSLGAGIGIDYYYGLGKLVPVTLDIRLAATEGKFSWVINLNGGYSYGLEYASNGFLINPSLGIRIYQTENIAILTSIGYKMQAQQIYYTHYGSYVQTGSGLFQFITFNTGLSF